MKSLKISEVQIAIALQQKCPIYVSRQVWEHADDMSSALEQATSDR